MKTLILHLKRFSIYSLMFASIGFVACEDENRQDMTPEIGEGEATPKITMYTPTAGEGQAPGGHAGKNHDDRKRLCLQRGAGRRTGEHGLERGGAYGFADDV